MLFARSKIGLTGLTAPNRLIQMKIERMVFSILAGNIWRNFFAFFDLDDAEKKIFLISEKSEIAKLKSVFKNPPFSASFDLLSSFHYSWQ